MAVDPGRLPAHKPRNIVIFSDGTGQRGGLYFDEERTNVYKLYRATRVSPDSNIDPDRQVAFYDPGLGTLQPGGSTLERIYRYIYNFTSRATGLGITRNIIDCYTAIIRLWQPGDRIFLFGFSRGAYTVRCLASVICYCGVPTTDRNGTPLRRDIGSTTKIATRAVKSVYQHVSSPRDEKYTGQRRALAELFRKEYGSNEKGALDSPNAYPHFIGVFDTVASLSNTGSLIVLCLGYTVLHIVVAWGLAQAFEPRQFWYWFGWVFVWTLCGLTAAYVFTHLKFAVRLPGYYFWDVIHLTSFRQKFYDQYLNPKVKYARHAISIDERRNDFQRVPWGSRKVDQPGVDYKIDPFEQFWFAGNHADIGGGYPENEARLSDIALEWMVQHAADPRLGEDALIFDRPVLRPNGRIDGMQHDETRSSAFRWAKKTLREPVHDATLHKTVLERFELANVQQYDVSAPYRPEALRGHEKVAQYYTDIPQPHTTCWQRITERVRHFVQSTGDQLNKACAWSVSFIYPETWLVEKAMHPEKKQITLDSVVSCFGLLSLVLLAGAAAWIFVLWQIVPWLRDGVWNSYSLSTCCGVESSWIGLQIIIDWLMKLPVTLALALLGVLLFRVVGLISAKIYQCASRNTGKIVTPAQTHA